jgi:hypothetical protein
VDPVSIIVGAVGAVGAGIAMAATRRTDSRRTIAWRQRAQDCGLADIQTGSRFLFMGYVEGRRGRHGVLLERFKRGKSARGSRVVVTGLADGLELKGEGLGSTIEKTLGAREVEIGDVPFDRQLFVRGRVQLARALLDAGTRRLATELFAGRVCTKHVPSRDISVSIVVANGELRAEFPDRFASGEDEPHTDTLQALLELAERLAPPGPLAPRLAAIAREDPVPLVRRGALATLEREYPQAVATREAMASARQDADPEVQLQAGVWLGAAGRPVLVELADSTVVPDSCSARALAALGEHIEPARVRSILDGARGSSRVLTAQAALAALVRGGAGSVDAIAPCLMDTHEEVAVAAAQALAATESPLAEDALLAALERGSDGLRLAAAQALGHVGTARAVMPLREFEGRGGGGADKVAREAIARIQSRLTGATPGQLALSGDDSGHVSLAEDPRGRVAMPDHDAEG